MKPKDLAALGIPQDCMPEAIHAIRQAFQNHTFYSKNMARNVLSGVATNPQEHLEGAFSDLAKAILASRKQVEEETSNWGRNPNVFPGPIGFPIWGESGIDPNAIQQMRDALEIPVAVAGALNADCHHGYALPIGGVLATYNSISPVFVGVDISCRMRLSILDIPTNKLEDAFSHKADPFAKALMDGTAFGVDSHLQVKAKHDVMDRDWNVSSTTKKMKDRAWHQMGTSGGGNHFVEFGIVKFDKDDFGLQAGEYVALLSHSGSRGTGKMVCDTYNDIAIGKLPKAYERFKDRAWLSMDSHAGQEYWEAMNLMAAYARANHDIIHDRVSDLIGGKIISIIQNDHNLAWKEEHNGQELYVHRKGATPAGEGVPGIIPGSLATPAFIVRGKGNAKSLNSASHGAGRLMSRTQAKKTFNLAECKSQVKQAGVRLLSAGLDEMPSAYKDIHEIMKAQSDLVDIVGRFDPKIVRMADDGKGDN